MKRVIIALLDSFGIGAAPDAAHFGDVGADTFGHIVEYCGRTRKRPLALPNLYALGLYHAASACRGEVFSTDLLPAAQPALNPHVAFGFAKERSFGKDTPSGHWELMGLPVEFDWGYFPNTPNCFPVALIDALIERGQLAGVLGQCHASGTTILKTLGEAHLTTGKPIVYTSADSVFQIAAHETVFGLDRLYDLCQIARELVDPYQVGRVIARPFLGDKADNFYRTPNRRDYATPPHGDTLLDVIEGAGGEVVSIGKVSDIFAHRGISRTHKAPNNTALFDTLLNVLSEPVSNELDRQLIFANFVDFDSSYGHRRDTAGYAAALEAFDKRLPELLAQLSPNDLLVLTADHGCDPTFPGSDHTRECVPLLCYGHTLRGQDLGLRASFADLGQTLASYFDLPALRAGESFWRAISADERLCCRVSNETPSSFSGSSPD